MRVWCPRISLRVGASILLATLAACNDHQPKTARGFIDRPATTATPPTTGVSPDTTAQANTAPTITGSPMASIVYGDSYSFQPIASDADGDTLRFGIVNRPRWAYFDPLTGKLQGKPGPADIGSFQGITISVSDGKTVATLAEFTVDVLVTGSKSITVSWVPATEREDGSPLVQFGGTKLYWGTARDNYPHSVKIDNPGVTTYVIDGLVPATYYLVATTFDSDGLESDFSDPASIAVR